MDTQVTEEDRRMVQGFHKLREMEARLKEMLEQPKPACLREEPQRHTFADADRSEDCPPSRGEPAKPLVRSNTVENPGASDATLAAKARLKRVFDKTEGPSRPLTPVSMQTSENLKTSLASSGYFPRRHSDAKGLERSHQLSQAGYLPSHHKQLHSHVWAPEPASEVRRLPENADRTAKIEDLEKKIFKLRQENSEFNPTTTRRVADPSTGLQLPPKTPTPAGRRMNLQTRAVPIEHRPGTGAMSAQQLPPRFIPKLEMSAAGYHRNTSFGQIAPASTNSLQFTANAYQNRPAEKLRSAHPDQVFERQVDSSARNRMQARAPQAHFYNPSVERLDTEPDSCSEMLKIDRLYSSFLENKKFWEDFKAKRESSKKTHMSRARELPSANRFEVQREYGIPPHSRDEKPAKKKVEAIDDWCDSSDLSDITERKRYNRPEKPERTRLLHK